MDRYVERFLNEFYRILDIDIQANRDAAIQEFERMIIIRATERMILGFNETERARYEEILRTSSTPEALQAFFRTIRSKEEIDALSHNATEEVIKEYGEKMLAQATDEQKEALRKAFTEWANTYPH